MKVRMLENGKVVDAKYYKNMTNVEVGVSTMFPDAWEDMDVFVYYNDIEEISDELDTCMVYLTGTEFEIINE